MLKTTVLRRSPSRRNVKMESEKRPDYEVWMVRSLPDLPQLTAPRGRRAEAPLIGLAQPPTLVAKFTSLKSCLGRVTLFPIVISMFAIQASLQNASRALTYEPSFVQESE